MWKVLVVDDEQDAREMMKEALMAIQPSIAIVEAINGADAIWKLNNDVFHLVITDLKMPKAPGTTIIKAFNNKMLDPVKCGKLKQIIVYTGAPEDLSHTLANDKVKVFSKGTDDGKLITHLTGLLAG